MLTCLTTHKEGRNITGQGTVPAPLDVCLLEAIGSFPTTLEHLPRVVHSFPLISPPGLWSVSDVPSCSFNPCRFPCEPHVRLPSLLFKDDNVSGLLPDRRSVCRQPRPVPGAVTAAATRGPGGIYVALTCSGTTCMRMAKLVRCVQWHTEWLRFPSVSAQP